MSFLVILSRNDEEIAKERDGIIKHLIDVLEQLVKESQFTLKPEDTEVHRMRYLSIASFKNVFVMDIEIEKREITKDQSYVHFELQDLRDKLGVATLKELLEKLHRINGFDWANPNVAERKQFTYKPIKYMTFVEDLNFNCFKKQLTAWFFELANLIASSL